MEFIVEEILQAIFEGLLYGRKVPKAVKYILATLLYGFVIAILVLCAVTAEKMLLNFFFMVFSVAFTIFYIMLLRKIHHNEMNDEL